MWLQRAFLTISCRIHRGSSCVFQKQSRSFPKERRRKIFKSASEILTENNIYTAVDGTVCMTKQKPGGLHTHWNSTRTENVAEVLQKQVEVHQKPTQCKGKNRCHQHLQHVFLGFIQESNVCFFEVLLGKSCSLVGLVAQLFQPTHTWLKWLKTIVSVR